MLRSITLLKLAKISILPCSLISRRSLLDSAYSLSQHNYLADSDDINLVENAKIINQRETWDALTAKIQNDFGFTHAQASNIINKSKKLVGAPKSEISRNIEILSAKNISLTSILQNTWLLVAPPDYLEGKIRLIEKMEPRNINDLIPLASVYSLKLLRMQQLMKKEAANIPHGSRIYYFAHRLKVKPAMVSKYFAKHISMFELRFDSLVSNLDLMLEYEMSPSHILTDLSSFIHVTTMSRARLERLREAGAKVLKPWMMRSTEKMLKPIVSRRRQQKELLGDKTVIEFLSERLGYDIETTKSIVSSFEKVGRVDVIKLNKFLDYLQIDEQFTNGEIATGIRVLTISLNTTKDRLNELRELGYRPTSLIDLCKSRAEFERLIHKIETQKIKNKI